jgi:hypothetical protein
MSQAFVLAPPPQIPRRRPNIHVPEYASQSQITFVQAASQTSDHKVSASAHSQASTSTLAVNVDGSRSSRASGKSFKRHFKSPFSKSSPSSPERPSAPAFPVHLAENLAAAKAKVEPSKPAKKSKAEKQATEKKIHTHANSKNQRPLNYATGVQLNMFMGGGTEEYWVAHARPTGQNEEDENVAEVGGFKDENGQIWWDVEEKAEWTSLLPKDEQGVQATSNDMWVEFNTDFRRNSTSSGDSTISFLSAEFAEDVEGPLFYRDAEMEQARTVYGMHKGTGTVLFPIDLNEEPHSPEATEARAIISQANGNWSNKSAIVIDDGFEDSFLSYESEVAGSSRRTIAAKEATVQMKPAKRGILKGLWGSKQASRD